MADNFSIPQFLRRDPTVTDDDKVICPGCAHQFRAIPIDVQSELSQPHLGLATTGQLLDELRARCEVNGTINYRTVDSD